jgi:hypothetical protein
MGVTEMMEAWPWALVIVGGPILLGLALLYGKLRSAKRDQQIDPATPGDDPAKGMRGRSAT